MNWPIGGCWCCCWPEDLGRFAPSFQGDAGGALFSLLLSSGAEMVGAAREVRSPTVLLRLDAGATPTTSVNSAFCLAMAAAASGNMRLIWDVSKPELRFPAPGDGGGRPRPME